MAFAAHDFPPYQTVFYYFRQWRRSGVWERVNTALREQVRVQSGRNAQPSAAIIDSQPVTTTEKGGLRGYDGGKNIQGRKRQRLVDPQGFLLKVAVGDASLSDKAGGQALLTGLTAQVPRLAYLWTASGYKETFAHGVRDEFGGWVEGVRPLVAPRGE